MIQGDIIFNVTTLDMMLKPLAFSKNFFLGSGSLNPTELRGVKRVGKHEKHYSNNKSALGEVHELLIRCCIG
jgi:hypothetical protein